MTRHSGRPYCNHGITPLLLQLVLFNLTPRAANAADPTFQIPPQSLDAALRAYANVTGTQLSYPGELSSGLQSPGVTGQHSKEDALQHLLEGSGLRYRFVTPGTVTLQRLSDTRTATQPAPSTKLTENAVDTVPPTTALPEMTVMGNAGDQTRYTVSRTTVGTKLDTPIMETPYSVKVIPQQVLRDQQVIRIEDAIATVAGVQSSFTNGGDSDVFIIRGFPNLNIYRDGFLLPSALGGGTLKRETANLEQIEVLKGPGSILYGRNEPGGVINLSTKRPLASPYYSLQQQFGSFSQYRTSIDATGPVSQDDTLLYRVNLSYENAGSYRDFLRRDTVFVAPSLTWNLSPRTQLNFDVEYQHFDNRNDSGVPPIGNRPAPVPINRQVGEPLNNKTAGERAYVSFNWSHELNDHWKLSHRFGAEFLDLTSLFTFYFLPATPEGDLINLDADFTNGGGRGFNNGIIHQQNYYTTLNLTGKFNTGVVEHATLWGFDYFVIDNQDSGACCAAFPIGGTFNIFNPVYQTSLPDLPFVETGDRTQNWYGLYFQDQFKLPYNFYGNFGLRYDNAVGYNNRAGLTANDDDQISPRGGLLWKPVPWVSLYGSYSENFGPNVSLFRSSAQRALPPQTAQQWELGAKTELLDGRLNGSFAYFDLTHQNLQVPDPLDPSLSITIGEQHSEGYEFELAGQVLPGWSLIGAYTHLADARTTRDVGFDGGPGNTGKRMYDAPRNFGSLWSTYEFLSGNLQGVRLGGGVTATSERQGTNDNSFQLPGYATVNLFGSYALKLAKSKVTLQLNINNLLDKNFYTGNNTSTMIGVGAPRSFLGSLRVEF